MARLLRPRLSDENIPKILQRLKDDVVQRFVENRIISELDIWSLDRKHADNHVA